MVYKSTPILHNYNDIAMFGEKEREGEIMGSYLYLDSYCSHGPLYSKLGVVQSFSLHLPVLVGHIAISILKQENHTEPCKHLYLYDQNTVHTICLCGE